MGISIGEIIIVAIIALLVVKPDDIPVLLRSVFNIRDKFSSLVHNVKGSVDSALASVHDEISGDEFEEVNIYLKKIMQSGKEYKGDYTLSSVKAFYHRSIIRGVEREDKKYLKSESE